MSIHLNDLVTKTCQPVAAGTVLRLLQTKCSWHLKHGTTPFKSKVPLIGHANEYKQYELTEGLKICNTTTFAKKEQCFRASVKRRNPFAGWTWHFWSVYEEALNPTFPAISPQFDAYGTIGEDDTEINIEVTCGPTDPVDPYEFGSTSIGHCNIHVDFIEGEDGGICDGNFFVYTATLGGFGLSYDYLAGTPAVQIDSKPAALDATDGFVPFAGYFTGVHWATPPWSIFPFGLVMNINHNMQLFPPTP